MSTAPPTTPAESRLPVVVMGVSAAGKSSVGIALAALLAVPFVDADDLHPPANVAKMAAGVPLDDDDRQPWLDEVGGVLSGAASGIVVACSALRRSYRDRLRLRAPRTVFVHLHGSDELLAARSSARSGHFMPSTLLASQLATLEPLGADEAGVVLDIAKPVDALAAEAAAWLSAR